MRWIIALFIGLLVGGAAGYGVAVHQVRQAEQRVRDAEKSVAGWQDTVAHVNAVHRQVEEQNHMLSRKIVELGGDPLVPPK